MYISRTPCIEENRDNIMETISFTRSTSDKHCERVTAGGQSHNGWGRHKFFPLANYGGAVYVSDNWYMQS